MTASIGEPPEAPSIPEPPIVAPRAPRNVAQSVAPDIHEICPYLAAAGGAWRSASPHREHRCGAVEPPAPLTSEKQRGLCLTAEHAGCATFRAARASRAAMLAPGVDPAAVAAADAARRPIARTSVVVLEHPRLSAPRARWPVDRAAPQAALIGLMIVAFIALAVARFSGPDQAGVAVSSPSPTHTASPTARPTTRPTPSPSVAPSAPVAASASPAPSAAVAPSGAVSGVTATPPPATKSYVVKKGDTLYGIASTFGTTVAEVKRINGLKDNSLKVGQKLKLP